MAFCPCDAENNLFSASHGQKAILSSSGLVMQSRLESRIRQRHYNSILVGYVGFWGQAIGCGQQLKRAGKTVWVIHTLIRYARVDRAVAHHQADLPYQAIPVPLRLQASSWRPKNANCHSVHTPSPDIANQLPLVATRLMSLCHSISLYPACLTHFLEHNFDFTKVFCHRMWVIFSAGYTAITYLCALSITFGLFGIRRRMQNAARRRYCGQRFLGRHCH
jgi:hypothetical protein